MKKQVPLLRMSEIVSFSCGRSILLAEIMKQTEKLIREGEALKSKMLAAAPKECQRWLRNTLVLEDLLQYGRTSRKYRHDDPENEQLGKNHQEVETRLRSLAIAWHNEVEIECSEDDGRTKYTIILKVA